MSATIDWNMYKCIHMHICRNSYVCRFVHSWKSSISSVNLDTWNSMNEWIFANAITMASIHRKNNQKSQYNSIIKYLSFQRTISNFTIIFKNVHSIVETFKRTFILNPITQTEKRGRKKQQNMRGTNEFFHKNHQFHIANKTGLNYRNDWLHILPNDGISNALYSHVCTCTCT